MPLWGKTDTSPSKPKFLSTAEKAKTFFVDLEEAQKTTNRIRGIKTPGWVRVSEKLVDGQIRPQVETLIAFTVATATSGDAADDIIVADANFAITTQPANTTVTGPAATSFTVAVNPSAGASYQWQVQTGGTGAYANITAFSTVATAAGTSSGTTATVDTATPHGLTTGNTVTIAGVTPAGYNGTYTVTVVDADTFTYTTVGSDLGAITIQGTAQRVVYTDATTATLNIANSTGLNNNRYRVIVLNSGGTASVTSRGVRLTVA